MKRRSLKINVISSWLAHAVALVVGLYLMPYVLHKLGDSTYGTWIFINSIAGYSALLYLGFGQTISRYVAAADAVEDRDKLNRIFNIVLAAYACLSATVLVLAALLAAIAPHVYDWGTQSVFEVQLVILILGINAALGMVGSVFGGVLAGIQRFDIDRGVNIVAGILRLVLTVAFLSSEWGLLTLALIFLMVTIIENLCHLFFAFRHVPTLSIGWRHLDRRTARECFGFSFFAFLETISYQLIELSDTVIIGLILGVEATVPYYIALRLCKFIGKPIQYVGHVIMPRAGELNATSESQKLRTLAVQGFGMSLLLMVGFFVGGGFFGRSLIATWVGPEYADSHLILLILLGAHVVAIPMDALRAVLFGMGDVKLPAILYFVEGIANVVLSILLIRPLGLIGVAIATLIPFAVFELGVLLPYVLRKLRITPGAFVRQGCGPQVLPLMLLLGYSYAVTAMYPEISGWISLAAVTVGGGVPLAVGWFASRRLGALQRWMQPLSPHAAS